jgi:hypothetical protein
MSYAGIENLENVVVLDDIAGTEHIKPLKM